LFIIKEYLKNTFKHYHDHWPNNNNNNFNGGSIIIGPVKNIFCYSDHTEAKNLTDGTCKNNKHLCYKALVLQQLKKSLATSLKCVFFRKKSITEERVKLNEPEQREKGGKKHGEWESDRERERENVGFSSPKGN